MFNVYSIISATIITVILTVISLRTQLVAYRSRKKGSKYKMIQDDTLNLMIFEKTGVKIKSFKVQESIKPFGLMIGIPYKPLMILSDKVYGQFNKDELQYVILHEIGHFKLKHSLKELLFSLFLAIIGIWIATLIPEQNHQILFSFVIGTIVGIINIQFARLSEYQADKFALKRLDNPAGMITATHKFRKARDKEGSSKIIKLCFERAIPYDKRIELALDEVENRKKTDKTT